MAQSRLGAKNEPIGSRPGDLSAWDKLMLGWLSYEFVGHGEDATIDLGPHEYNTAKAAGGHRRSSRDEVRHRRVRRPVRG